MSAKSACKPLSRPLGLHGQQLIEMHPLHLSHIYIIFELKILVSNDKRNALSQRDRVGSLLTLAAQNHFHNSSLGAFSQGAATKEFQLEQAYLEMEPSSVGDKSAQQQE